MAMEAQVVHQVVQEVQEDIQEVVVATNRAIITIGITIITWEEEGEEEEDGMVGEVANLVDVADAVVVVVGDINTKTAKRVVVDSQIAQGQRVEVVVVAIIQPLVECRKRLKTLGLLGGKALKETTTAE